MSPRLSDLGRARNLSHRSVLLGAVAVGLATFMFFLFCSFRQFSSQGEPREALVAKAMVESGDYVIPYRYDDVFATKPPMVHWMMLLASGGSFPQEWQTRMPSAVLSGVVSGLLFWFLGCHVSMNTGLLAVLLLNSCPLWIRGSLEARVDEPLASFFFVSLISFFTWSHLKTSNYKKHVWFFVGVISLVCGLLTKGPVVAVLFATIVGAFLFLNSVSFGRIFRIITVFLFPGICVAFVWYYFAYLQRGDEFLAVILSENLKRMQGTMLSGEDPHQHNVFYLFYTGLLGTLPLSLSFILAVTSHRDLGALKGFNLRRALERLRNNPPLLFSFIAVVVPTVFFSIPSSKRAEYLLPCYPFAAILVAYWLSAGGRLAGLFEDRLKVVVNAIVALAIGGMAVVGVTFFFINEGDFGIAGKLAFYIRHKDSLLLNCVWFVVLSLLSIGLVRLLLRDRPVFFTSLSSYLLVVMWIGGFVLPPLNALNCCKHFMVEFDHIVERTALVYSKGYQWDAQFYTKHKLKVLPEIGPLQEGAYILLDSADVKSVRKRVGVEHFIIQANSEDGVRKPGHRLVLAQVIA